MSQKLIQETLSQIASLTRERDYYREILEQIHYSGRRTREARLASSAILFWDQMQKAKKEKP